MVFCNKGILVIININKMNDGNFLWNYNNYYIVIGLWEFFSNFGKGEFKEFKMLEG